MNAKQDAETNGREAALGKPFHRHVWGELVSVKGKGEKLRLVIPQAEDSGYTFVEKVALAP